MDENYVYGKVTQRRDIFSEISKLKQALKPFRAFIGDHEPSDDNYVPLYYYKKEAKDGFKDTKSKPFYNGLIMSKIERTSRETMWKNMFGHNDMDFMQVYKKKIVKMCDRKLAEFNFKVIHNILPCNVNLVRWKKKDIKQCSICGVDEDIVHLLFDCQFAKNIWHDLKYRTDIQVVAEDVIIGNNLSESHNILVTIIAYQIYKHWLLESFNGVKRQVCTLQSFIPDLKNKYDIYLCAKKYKICEALLQVIV